MVGAHGGAAGRTACRFASEVLPPLLERLGDANARIGKAACDTAVALAASPNANLPSLTGLLVKCAFLLGIFGWTGLLGC